MLILLIFKQGMDAWWKSHCHCHLGRHNFVLGARDDYPLATQERLHPHCGPRAYALSLAGWQEDP